MNYLRLVCVRSVMIASIGSAVVTPAFGQGGGGSGTLIGTVVDSTGAAVPGATVNAVEESTGTTRTVVSNPEGLFRLPALNPGKYILTIELSSFRSLTVADITLSSSEIRDLGRLTLEIGALSETVSVTSEVTPVQIADSSRRATITIDDLSNIQVKGRDVMALLSLLPGVQDTNLNRDFAQWRSAINLTINGAPSQSKDVRVDGINVVDEGGCGTAFVNLNMDAIGEVQVIANGYSAENGRNNGGLINVVTKSGSSTLKASGWYSGRRDDFNANDYFRKSRGLGKPLYEVNISGYSVGGPVVIPGLVDSRAGTSSRRKLYFFASQEYTDDARPTNTTRSNLPTELERQGNFSETRITNGTIQPIIDPLTGQPFPGNIIPANRINPLGQKMLGLLPTANGILNPAAGQQWTSNSAFDLTPKHGRTNHVLRMDAVLTEKTRATFKMIKDRDDDWRHNAFTPGTGFINQNTPGILLSSTVTQVLRPTVVNEINFGYTHNRWGFKAADDFDYRTLYRSSLGIDPPRFEPFGDYTDPPQLSGFGGAQVDEWPYAPIFTTAGGNRAGLAAYRNGDEPLPKLNLSARFAFQDDLSIVKGRHNIKMGVFIEYNRKTEPGSQNYMGNFDFGHNANNPLSTGNGYANMLLGVFNTYTELTSRVDRDVRHWQNDGYIQDNWRVNERLTLDYGLRIQHSGSYFEMNEMNSGFFADQWNRAQAPRVYSLVCMDGRPGNQTCPANLQRTIDPANPSVFFSSAFNGNIVPGTGNTLNGIRTGGIEGKKPGTYFTFPYFVYAPRAGFAWNIFGDGKTALRGSWGIFYNFPRSNGAGAVTTGATGAGGYPFSGGCPISCQRQIRWATFNDITLATPGNLVENPANVNLALYEQPLAKSHNVNIAFQRDIGFNTVAEIAYVGNFTEESGRTVDQNRLPLYVYGNPNTLVNNAPIGASALRQVYGQYPGLGSVNVLVPDLYAEILRYNALQLQVQRRLSKGLQMGMSYTLAKGLGYQGYDPYTDEIGGKDAIRARYWGPTPNDRRHNLVINYSYIIPELTNTPVAKQLLSNWQVSGVARWLTGQAVTPTCQSNNPGIENTNPSLTDGFFMNDATRRCELTGEPLFVEYTGDPNLPFPDRPHFNLAAFRMPQPNGSIGNFGNSPVGLLRHPSWHQFDLTLSRRFPITFAGRRNSGITIRIEAYNVFNEVQFTNLNAAYTFTGPNNSVINTADTGKYTATGGSNLAAGTIQPRTLGLTARVDW
jgi:hypothetical protein